MDGFDSYEQVSDLSMEYTNVGFNLGIEFSQGRWGGTAISLQGYNNALSWLSPNNLTEIWAGMAIELQSNIAYYGLGFFYIGSVSGLELYITLQPNTFVWTVYRASSDFSVPPQNLGSVLYPIRPVGYHWIDIHYIMSPTTSGVVELWMDGTQIINVTGANTTQFGSTVFNTVNFGSNAGPNLSCFIDDIYILNTAGSYNNTRLGDSKIFTAVPDADGSVNNGTPYQQGGLPFYGPNYKMVNELYWSDYNVVTLSSTVGQEELYYTSEGNDAPEGIHAIRVLALANASDSNNVITANTIVISGGVEADGNSTVLSTSYSHVTNIFETCPSTSAPWADYNIYGAQSGFKIT